MEQLRLVGSQDGHLLLAAGSGERYRVEIDDRLRSELRRSRERPAVVPSARPRPREIQAQIRAGLSAADVADLLGIGIEDVERFEPPVLAEREYIVSQALSVPVILSGELDAAATSTFGTAVRAKLAEAEATSERWTSWKEPDGWIVKLSFQVREVDRDARWSFDPRRSTLAPLNPDATQLSRQGSLPEGLIPRLRALDAPALKDQSRFDSGAFAAARADLVSSTAVEDAAVHRAPDAPVTSPDTADLLEALRRRRGERTAPPEADGEPGWSLAPVPLFDDPEPAREDGRHDERDTGGENHRRRGRPAMPSWDEIVFGARGDDA